MASSFEIAPAPLSPAYIRSIRLNPGMRLTYPHQAYSSTVKSAIWPAMAAGIFSFLINEDGTGDNITQETALTDDIAYEDSSSTIQSVIYMVNDTEPLTYGGISTGKADTGQSDTTDLSIVFPKKYFKPGQIMTLEVTGKITENAINTSCSFTIIYPDPSGSTATLAMPTTVNANSLSGWTLTVISKFSVDSTGGGVVIHTGSLVVANTTVTYGESTIVLSAVENTFDYDTVTYYKPQITWNAQNLSSTIEVYSAS